VNGVTPGSGAVRRPASKARAAVKTGIGQQIYRIRWQTEADCDGTKRHDKSRSQFSKVCFRRNFHNLPGVFRGFHDITFLGLFLSNRQQTLLDRKKTIRRVNVIVLPLFYY
jgi:hypothetical protein